MLNNVKILQVLAKGLIPYVLIDTLGDLDEFLLKVKKNHNFSLEDKKKMIKCLFNNGNCCFRISNQHQVIAFGDKSYILNNHYTFFHYKDLLSDRELLQREVYVSFDSFIEK